MQYHRLDYATVLQQLLAATVLQLCVVIPPSHDKELRLVIKCL